MTPRPLRPAALGAALVLAVAGAAACEDDSARDGWARVATGDTYGEWELFAEYEDGDWTGCLRFGSDDAPDDCADPDADDLVTFDSGDGASFGAVPEVRPSSSTTGGASRSSTTASSWWRPMPTCASPVSRSAGTRVGSRQATPPQ